MNRTWTVFWKELREVLRDRRVLFSTVVSPLLFTPLLLWGIGLMVQQRVESARKVTIPTAVVAPRGGEGFLQTLEENGFRLQRVVGRERAEAMLRQRQVWAVVLLDEQFDERLQNESTAKVVVLFDPLNESSREAVQRVKMISDQLSAQWVQQRLARRFIGAEFTQPLALVTQPIETENPVGNLFLSIILPYVIVLSGFFGAVSPAFDLIAGEKERGTLETLLATPASRQQIVWGKFLTVAAVCLVAALFAMLGMLLAFSLPASSHLFTEQVGKFNLPPLALVALLITLLPLSVFYSAILTIISTFARNQKEAQTYLIPLSTLVVLPAVASMFARTESGLWLAGVPILNSAMIIKQVLTGVLDPLFVTTSLLASALVAVVSLHIATRLFERETILLSS